MAPQALEKARFGLANGAALSRFSARARVRQPSAEKVAQGRRQAHEVIGARNFARGSAPVAAAGRDRGRTRRPRSPREPPRHAPRRFGDLVGIAGEAQPEMSLAAGAEGGSRRGADAGFIDEAQRQRARVGKAVDRAEEIERRLRLEEAYPPGPGQLFA